MPATQGSSVRPHKTPSPTASASNVTSSQIEHLTRTSGKPPGLHRLRGVTLIEVLIVVAILGLMSAAIAVAVIPTGERAKFDIATQNARALRSAALQWRATFAKTECPTVASLRQDRVLDRSAKTEDPWGAPYRIKCEDDEIYVSSLGKDGKEGSPDDIVEPPKESR